VLLIAPNSRANLAAGPTVDVLADLDQVGVPTR
jgi:hypothetical protein